MVLNIEEEQKIVIWGTGNTSINVTKELYAQNLGERIIYYIDNEKDKQNLPFLSRMVYSYDKLVNEKNVLVIIASMYYGEISEQLKEMGCSNFINGIDFFNIPYNFISFPGFVENKNDGFTILRGSNNRGRVLLKKDEYKNIYRGIFKDYSKDCEDIINICNLNGIIGDYIIETKISNENIEPFGLILEQKKIDRFTYPVEWSPYMFKDATNQIINLISKLHQYKLTLSNVNPYIVTYDNCKFKLVDVTVLQKGTLGINLVEELFYTLINPLILMSKSKYNKAILYMKEKNIGIDYEDIIGYLKQDETVMYNTTLNTVRELIAYNKIDKVLIVLKDYITNININLNDTVWTTYQDYESLNDESIWSYKNSLIINFIRNNPINNILDIAGNLGWYCIKASQYNIKSIVGDLDYEVNNKSYCYLKETNNNMVIPLVMDFNKPYKDVTRFKSDLVMSLAVIHHLVFSNKLSFEDIIKQLNEYTNKYLIIEFINRNDKWIYTDINNELYNWYNIENFEDVLKKYFKIIKKDSLDVENERSLYFCVK